MKTSTSNQNVLILTNDLELETILRSAFNKEAEVAIATNSEQALRILETNKIQTLLIDALTTDPKLHYFEDNLETSFFEIMQYANQLNHGLTIVLLVTKMLTQDGKFARKCGATLTMDRKAISINVLAYVSEVLRKRTFRTVLLRDIAIDANYPTDIYHYLPVNKRYSVFLQENTPFTEEKYTRLKKAHVRHLYVHEDNFEQIFPLLKHEKNEHSISEDLAIARADFRRFLIDCFDVSTDNIQSFGKTSLETGMNVVKRLQKIINQYPTPYDCLSELPYPRWSALAHALNCTIYTLLFAKYLNLNSPEEMGFAALVHNLGLAEIKQDLVHRSESSLDPNERIEYQSAQLKCCNANAFQGPHW